MATGDKLVTLDGLKAVYQDLNGKATDLKSAVFDEVPTTAPIEWEQGMISSSGGGKVTNVKRLITNAFSLTDEIAIAPTDGYAIQLYAYNGATYLGVWDGTSFEKTGHLMEASFSVGALPRTYTYKLMLRHTDETGITEMPVSEYVNCIIRWERYLDADDYHPEIAENAANDAKYIQSGFLPCFDCEIGGISNSGNKNTVTNVIRTKTAVKFDYDVIIRSNDTEYNYAVWDYTASEITSDNYKGTYSGAVEGTRLLKANEYYAITIGKRVKETVDNVDTYAKTLEVWSPLYLETMRKYEMKSFAPMGNSRRKIIGHQGNSSNYPGNTIPAFEEAGAGGVWGIETDINVTSDGYLVCIHDTTLDATTNGTGSVIDHTLAEVRALHIKNHDDLQVPTVEEFLSICKVYGCVPVLELKNVASDQTGIASLLSTIKDYGFENTAIILCSQYSIGYVQCISPKNPCIFNIDPTDLETWIPRTGRYFNTNVTMASGTYTVTQEIVSQLHDAGFSVCVGGVNTVEAIKNYFAMGADAVSSDIITTY